MAALVRIVPHLWYNKEAEDAAHFYTSIFPDSRIDRVTSMPTETPSGPPGSVKVVDLTIFGQPIIAITAGPLEPFNHAISFCVMCETQAEIDEYWAALLDGGSPEQCGWLKDRYGVAWQVMPVALGDMLADPDPARAKRVADAMLTMKKFDLAGLEAAYSN